MGPGEVGSESLTIFDTSFHAPGRKRLTPLSGHSTTFTSLSLVGTVMEMLSAKSSVLLKKEASHKPPVKS